MKPVTRCRSPPRNTGLSRLEVRGSTFRGTDTGINVNLATIKNARIEENRFSDIAGVAIMLGSATYGPFEWQWPQPEI